jgi:hypothetical protein
MEVQRDGSLEKGSVDLVFNAASGPGGAGGSGSADASLVNVNNSNNHNTITYNDPADTSE